MASILNLKSKIAAVTGASRGIGAAIAEALAAEGCHLALTAQQDGGTDELAQRLRDRYGVTCLSHSGDVRDAAAAQSFYKQIHATFSRLDILAANAWILGDGLLGMIPLEQIERTLDVNVVGTLHHLQAAARLMRRQKAGRLF